MKQLSDLTVPQTIARGPLPEAEVQKQCVDWMRGRGYWARKFSSMSQRSVPDYIFSKRFCPQISIANGAEFVKIKFFTEFKREGAPRDPITGLMSTQAQQDEQQLMREAGWAGFESDNFGHFQAMVFEIEANLYRYVGC